MLTSVKKKRENFPSSIIKLSFGCIFSSVDGSFKSIIIIYQWPGVWNHYWVCIVQLLWDSNSKPKRGLPASFRAYWMKEVSMDFLREWTPGRSKKRQTLRAFLSVQHFSSAHVISKNFFSLSRLSLNGERCTPRFLRRRSHVFGYTFFREISSSYPDG